MTKYLKIGFISSLLLVGVFAFWGNRVDAQVTADKPSVIYTQADARANVNSSTIGLTYNSDKSEALLTAKFNLLVSGGTKGINVYKNGYGVLFYNLTRNTPIGYPNSAYTELTSTSSNLVTVKDQYGQEMWQVGAGKTVNFIVNSSVNAGQLFAGQYVAKYENLFVNNSIDFNKSGSITTEGASIITRPILVIGEKSPYIESISEAVSGKNITIRGERLNHITGIYIDNAQVIVPSQQYTDSITFLFPLIPPATYHNLYLVDSKTGQSNTVSFQMGTTTSSNGISISKTTASPEDSIVIASGKDKTPDVVLLVGKITNTSNTDAAIYSLPITLNTNGDSLSAIASNLTLRIQTTTDIKKVNFFGTNTGVVSFTPINVSVRAGETVEFTVSADIKSLNNSFIPGWDFDEGDYLIASVNAGNVTDMRILDSKGNKFDGKRSGVAVGEAQEFRSKGIGLTLVSTRTDAIRGNGSADDTGLFTIKYKVTAIGESVYVGSMVNPNTLIYTIDNAGTATSSRSMTAILVNNDDNEVTKVGNYKIEAGETETFTLIIAVPSGQGSRAGQYRAALTAIKWSSGDNIQYENTYSSPLDDFKTSYIVLDGGAKSGGVTVPNCPIGFTCSSAPVVAPAPAVIGSSVTNGVIDGICTTVDSTGKGFKVSKGYAGINSKPYSFAVRDWSTYPASGLFGKAIDLYIYGNDYDSQATMMIPGEGNSSVNLKVATIQIATDGRITSVKNVNPNCASYTATAIPAPTVTPTTTVVPKPTTTVTPAVAPSPVQLYVAPTTSVTPKPVSSPSPSPSPSVVQTPVAAIVPTIKASQSYANSGAAANISFTYPSNTIEANVYTSCPSGVTSSPANICNQYTSVLNSLTWNPVFNNTTTQSQSIYMIYYIRLATGEVRNADLSFKLVAPTVSPSGSPQAVANSNSASIFKAIMSLFGL